MKRGWEVGVEGGGWTVPWASCHERVEGNGLHWTQFTLEQHLLWPRTVYTHVDMHWHVWPSHWAFFSQHLRFEKKRGHGEHCLHSLQAVVLPDCRHLISAACPKAAHRIQHFADIWTHTDAHTHTHTCVHAHTHTHTHNTHLYPHKHTHTHTYTHTHTHRMHTLDPSDEPDRFWLQSFSSSAVTSDIGHVLCHRS